MEHLSIVRYAFEDCENLYEFADLACVAGTVEAVHPKKSSGDPECLGIDLFAAYDFRVEPFSVEIVNTGVCFDLDQGALLWPKSRNNHLLGAGAIDKSYIGPVYVKIVNPTSRTMSFQRGDGICQMIGARRDWGDLIFVDRIEKQTARGRLGGITGVSADGEVLPIGDEDGV